jgi:hypothetical protein
MVDILSAVLTTAISGRAVDLEEARTSRANSIRDLCMCISPNRNEQGDDQGRLL